MAMELEEFQFVLLRRPAAAAELDEATAARLQQEHLAFYAGLRRTGEVVTNGPMVDQPDERLRGLVVFAVGSQEAAREIAARDPLVQARPPGDRGDDLVVSARHDGHGRAANHRRLTS